MLLFLGWLDKNAIRCLAGDDAEIKQTEKKKGWRKVKKRRQRWKEGRKEQRKRKGHISWQSKERNQMRVNNERRVQELSRSMLV